MRMGRGLNFVGLVVWAVVAGCGAADAGERCVADISGTVHSFEHVYVLRAHDPYDGDDTTRLARIVCSDTEIGELPTTEGEAMEALMMRPDRGLVVEVRDNGEIVTAAVTWDGKDAYWPGPFGGFSELTFTGTSDGERISGSVETNTKLEDSESGVSLSLTAEIDAAVDVTF